MGDKLMKIHGTIDFAQLVVVEALGRSLHDGLHFGLENRGLASLEPLDDLAGASDARVELRDRAQMKQHHLAKHLANAATGERVVADKSDALRSQNRLGQRQQ